MKHLRLYIVLTAAAAVTPFVVRIAQGQEQEMPADAVPVMPQQGANETTVMPDEMPAQEAQGVEEQQPDIMPEQQAQPEMMDATSQPATTQSVAEEEDDTSPQAKRAASQRAIVAERNRQNRTQGRQVTHSQTPQNGRQQNNNRSATSRPVSYSELYGLLTTRNIFLKDRRHPTTASATQPATGAAVRPVGERALVLTGVAIENDGYHAYFEDLNASTIKKAGIGDTVGQGRILAVDIDAVQYEANGQQRSIKIGQDLTGHDSAPPPSFSSAASSATTLPAELVGKSLTDPNLTPEQRMKLRRALEMQKQQ